MSKYFPEPKLSGGTVKIELDLSNYAKNTTGVGTSKSAKKVDLASLKTNIDKLDIGKLETAPVDLSKLSNVIKNDVVKKAEYNAKIKSIEDKILDITNLATKTTLNAKINEVKGEMTNITNLATTAVLNAKINGVKGEMSNIANLATTAVLNAKINEVKGKIPNITNLASTTALTIIENKIPNVSNLVKKN